jgi:hypothetical protein
MIAAVALDTFEILSIASGRDPIALGGEGADLADNPELWAALYRKHRAAVLSQHVRNAPGSRPRGWCVLDAGRLPKRAEDECETQWLFRVGQLDAAELAAIAAKARELIRHNMGRDPSDRKANWIPDQHGFIEFCAEHELLSDDELPEVF